MFSGISPSAVSGFVFEVTVTLTTAGVTRAASVSMALSSAMSALTLSRSSGPAAGVALAAFAAAGLTNSYVTNDATKAIANRGAINCRVKILAFSFHLRTSMTFILQVFYN